MHVYMILKSINVLHKDKEFQKRKRNPPESQTLFLRLGVRGATTLRLHIRGKQWGNIRDQNAQYESAAPG